MHVAHGVYVLIDPEEEFAVDEVTALWREYEHGLSVIVLADWYNTSVMRAIAFHDEHTKCV